MSAKILIVDDVIFNIKLLENKLKFAYYDVFTASTGKEAIQKVYEVKPDLILMDIMMPDIDGIEATKRIKAIPEFSHIPIVMVTALSSQSDKVSTLIAGADDFITKPVNDKALITRVKSLLRAKFAVDELRLRADITSQLGLPHIESDENIAGSKIMLVDDNPLEIKKIEKHLHFHGMTVEVVSDPEEALQKATQQNEYSVIIVSIELLGYDGLRLCSQIKSNESSRGIPIVILVDEDYDAKIERGLEIGVQDYVISPVDPSELIARLSKQILRKKYHDMVNQNYLDHISLSVLDPLTKLHNRRYLDTYLENFLKQSHDEQKDLTIIMIDLDNFKSINDTYGHASGDEVLRQASERITSSIRHSDLCVRYGGDEFIIALPSTDAKEGKVVAERILSSFRGRKFIIKNNVEVDYFCSIGIATMKSGDTIYELLKSADDNLYKAKNIGRNILYSEV